jgi:hypothetical protein
MSQDLLEDSMPHDPGTACDPIAQQHVTATSTDSSTHCPKKRMSFVNQGIRATKTFFMFDHEGNLFNEIDSHHYLNGKVLSAPRKGIHVYKLFWDTSSLPNLVIEESKLRCTVAREDKEMVSCIKIARLLFDQTYPNGPPPGALMVNNLHVRKKQHRSKATKSRQDSQQSAVNVMGASVDETSPSNSNRQSTNIRMAPVLGNTFIDSSNDPHNNMQCVEENEGYDSDEERYGEEFVDDNEGEELGNNDRLHGYLPDGNYVAESTEEDGRYPEELTWSYEDLPTEGLNEDLYRYSGPGPCLRPYVSTKFRTVLEACGVQVALLMSLSNASQQI